MVFTLGNIASESLATFMSLAISLAISPNVNASECNKRVQYSAYYSVYKKKANPRKKTLVERLVNLFVA